MPEVTYTRDKETGIATFTIDTAGPVNTIGQQFMTDLERAVEQAIRDDVSGVLFVSAKKRSFLDGANLREVLTDATPPMVRIAVSRFQDILAHLATAPFPVAAILAGQSALGGGFELLLWACDRVFASPGSKVGLPETNVGLFPAGGGTQTLKRVVGFKTAVDMITTARVSSVETFAETSLFTLCEPGELTSKAMEWLQSNTGIVNRNYDPDHTEPDPLPDEEKQTILNKARFRYTICPHRTYLKAAIDALEAGIKLPFDEAARNEVDLFVPLFFTPGSRNKIDLFFLMTSIAPRLARTDRKVAINPERVVIIGAGLMGQGIAQVMADKGMKVTLIDRDEETTKSAVDAMEATLDGLVSRGRWPQARKDSVMGNIDWTTGYDVIKDAQLVIECVFENLDLKRDILKQVQDVNPDVIFASNTSTLPMQDIAAGAERPDQVVGMHFFSPVPLMPLLEVVRGPQSSPAAQATAVSVGRSIGKTVILVEDGPGFYTSRTFGQFVQNGFRLAELGISPWDVDMLAFQAGFPQGPLHVYGTTGGDVIYHAGKFMESRIPERMKMAPTLIKVHEAGYVGAGKPCFYVDNRKMIRDESILDHIVKAEGLPVPDHEEAKDILLLGMVNEAFWCLNDGVLSDYYSMELGAVLGIGFPDCWHGPGRYAGYRGVSSVKNRLIELRDKFSMASLDPAPEFDRIIACGLERALV